MIGIEQAAGGSRRRRHLGEDPRGETAESLPQQRAEDQHQPAEAEQRGGERERHGDGILSAASGIELVHGCYPIRLFDPHQHVARGREHDEGDDEEDQAERDQRRGVEVADRFGEFVGDGRRYGGAGREHRSRNPVRVADDEGHRHGLAERAAKAEHHPADDADPGIGQHDIAHHLPGGAAEAIGRLLEHRRHRLEHVARDRGDERQHHDGEDQAGGQHADAVGRTGEQRGQHRNFAEHSRSGTAAASPAGTARTRTGPRCRR